MIAWTVPSSMTFWTAPEMSNNGLLLASCSVLLISPIGTPSRSLKSIETITVLSSTDDRVEGLLKSYKKPSAGLLLTQWPWMTSNCAGSRSSKRHVKYFKTCDRYDDAVNRSRIGSHPWAHGLSVGSMTFDLRWPWTVLDLGHETSATNAVRDKTFDTMELI